MRTDEAFLVAKYQAPKVERALDPTTGVMFEKTPEVQVVVFLDPDLEDVPKQETSDGDTYKTLQDYLKDNYEEGFFVEEEERQDHKGTPVTVQSIKVEGGVATLETRIVAWIYECEVGDVAVYYEVIQDAYKEHRGDIDKLMRSFKPIARTGDIRLGGGKGGFVSSSELKDLTPEERKEKKIEAQRAEFEAMVAALPADWEHYELDGVQVVTHADKKFTKEVVEQVNAVYDWLDATFPGVGRGTASESAALPTGASRAPPRWSPPRPCRPATPGHRPAASAGPAPSSPCPHRRPPRYRRNTGRYPAIAAHADARSAAENAGPGRKILARCRETPPYARPRCTAAPGR
jgi:hypothetical protein